MIDIKQPGLYWPILNEQRVYQATEVEVVPVERVSALLGPDGKPLMIPVERHRIGFDLTPRKKV